MPGLHERLDAQRKATQDLHGLVTRLESTMKQAISHTQDATMHRLESEFHLMFRRIRESTTDFFSEESSPPPNSTRETTETTTVNSTRSPLNTLPLMPITYSSICQLYNHWNGEGEYGSTCAGGISKLESEKGSTWRRNWDNAANKRLSKVKAIVAAIRRESNEKNISITEVITMWEDIYSGECKGKISNFHAWAVKNNKLELKKARGKSAAESN